MSKTKEADTPEGQEETLQKWTRTAGAKEEISVKW